MSLSQLPRGALRRVRRLVAAATLGPDHGVHCACCAPARPRPATIHTAAPVRPAVDLLPPVPVRRRRVVGLHLVQLERQRAEEAARGHRTATAAATAAAYAPRLAAAAAVGRRAEAARRAAVTANAAIAADAVRAARRGVPRGDGLDDVRAELGPLLRYLVDQRRGVAA
jgi:hypothetical protein